MSALSECRHGDLETALAHLDGDRIPSDPEVRGALMNVIEHVMRLERRVALPAPAPNVQVEREANFVLEAAVDIAYLAGCRGWYSGDSRADMNSFICWAQEFERAHRDPEPNVDDTYMGGKSYMEAIEDFATAKFDERAEHDDSLREQRG